MNKQVNIYHQIVPSTINSIRAVLGPRAIMKRLKEWYQDIIPLPDDLRIYTGGLGGWGGGLTKAEQLYRHFPHDDFRYNILYGIHSRIAPEVALRAKNRGVKIVYNASSVALPAYYPDSWKVMNEYRRKVYELADYTFIQGCFAKEVNEQFLGPLNAPNEVLYNAVDLAHFIPNNSHSAISPVTILAAGSHHYAYELEVTLFAVEILKRKIPGIRLMIAGTLRDGAGIWNAKSRTVQLIQQLGLADSVILTSTYSRKDAPEIYNAADILVHATWNDVCPNTVLEGMACGLPVVYSDSGGTPEVVGPEAGVSIPSSESWDEIQVPDPAAIADAVLEVLEDRQAYGDAARTRAVENFDERVWIERHENVFSMLLEN